MRLSVTCVNAKGKKSSLIIKTMEITSLDLSYITGIYVYIFVATYYYKCKHRMLEHRMFPVLAIKFAILSRGWLRSVIP